MDDIVPKAHRKRQAGRKAEKKNKKDNSKKGQPNPKAFGYNSARSAEKAFHRTQDVLEKKHHLLVVDRTSDLPPPVVVVVAGPPKCGKSTLIQALVRNYTRKRVTKVQGPITVIAGKGENKTTKRLTFIESLCDIHSMVDAAKVADLVILMMNGNKKHQMETFEFLTLCRAHNFTKILGVVTHLDLMKTNEMKKNKKKKLKRRFWDEVCEGAKIHFLDGFDKGSYMKPQIRLLGHSVSRFKYAPRAWLTSHPFIIADRMEDITNPEEVRKNPVVERNVCLYGYVRGTFFNSKVVHIPGCGDYPIQDISCIADPCPPLDQVKKRSLNDRERRLYAPMSGVGGILYDKDAIYMDIGGSHALRNETERQGPYGEYISSLKNLQGTIDEKIAEDDGSEDGSDDEDESDDGDDEMDVDGEDDDEDDDEEGDDDDDDSDDDTDFEEDDDDEEDGEGSSKKRKLTLGSADGVPSKKRKLNSMDESDGEDDDDCDEEEEEEEEEEDENNEVDGDDIKEGAGAKWKENLKEKGLEAFHKRHRLTMEALVYNPPKNILPDSEDEDENGEGGLVGGLFGVLKKNKKSLNRCWVDDDECVATSVANEAEAPAEKSDFEQLSDKIRDCFVTGKFAKGEDAESRLREDDELNAGSDDGDEKDDSDDGWDDSDDNYSCDDDSEDDDGKEDNEEKGNDNDGDKDSEEEALSKAPPNETIEERRERRMKLKLLKKKKRQRAMMLEGGEKGEKTVYEQQREEMQLQAEMNRNEFKDLDPETRIKVEGFRPGLYVRVELKIDCEFVKYFDPNYLIILGGILPKEDELGFVTTKMMIHRYQKLPLRNRDPALISLGWRRMESIVLFSMKQDNHMYKSLKQATPCMSCIATFWGPITPQKTSIVFYSTDRARKFRVTAAGTVSKQDKSVEIKKKITLRGFPHKIFNKTAFIKGMFNSDFEAAKFEHAAVQTVSGIRGTIKKASKVDGVGPPGLVRVTFEDKILLSDIVILKGFTMLDQNGQRHWQTVPNFLLPVNERSKWVGMKLMYHLMKERNIKNQFNPDSQYRKIERQVRVPKPFTIPRELQKELPYKDKPKVDVNRKDVVQSSRIAVIKEPEERRRDDLMKKITAIDTQRRKVKWQEMRDRAALHQKKMAKEDEIKNSKKKKLLKETYAKLGRMSKKN